MPSKKSRLRLYADECFPFTSVTYLRSLGISIVHAIEEKTLQKSDKHHFKVSKKLNRVLITLDRDFLYYTQADLSTHPGVIAISTTSTIPPLVNEICDKLLKHVTNQYVKHAVVHISKEKIMRSKLEKHQTTTSTIDIISRS